MKDNLPKVNNWVGDVINSGKKIVVDPIAGLLGINSNTANPKQGIASQPKVQTTPIGSSIGGVLGNTTPSNASTPITFNQLAQNALQFLGLKGNDVDGKLEPLTTSAVLNTAVQNATGFAKNNPELVLALVKSISSLWMIVHLLDI